MTSALAGSRIASSTARRRLTPTSAIWLPWLTPRGSIASRCWAYPAAGRLLAIEYAARNPERVTHLVLYGSYARGRYRRGEGEFEQSRLLGELMRVGWGGTVPAFRQVFSSMFIPSAGEEQKRWYDDMQQASSSGEVARNGCVAGRAPERTSATRRAGSRSPRSWYMRARGDRVAVYEEGRRLASSLPNARFVTLGMDNHILQEGEPAWEVFLAGVAHLPRRWRTKAHPCCRSVRAE